MKTIKLFFATVLLLLSGSAGAMAHSDDDSTNGKPKTRQEVEKALDNYRISYFVDALGQIPFSLTQTRCEQAWAFRVEKDRGNQFLVVDEAAEAVYNLNFKEKTGECYPLDPTYEYWGLNLPHLFFHESMNFINDTRFEKTGDRETIAGRPTTVYVFQYNNGVGTFWIDDEYGFLLKYIQAGANDMHVEVTEFTVGGITLADIVDLSEYSITSAPMPKSESPSE